jgi:hypothetical protein
MPGVIGQDDYSPFITIGGLAQAPILVSVTKIKKVDGTNAGAGTTDITMDDGTVYTINQIYSDLMARISRLWPR